MNQDANPKFQPNGTYRFALNAVLETKDGHIPSLSNELGNYLLDILPDGKTPIGHVIGENHEVILFLYDPEGVHEIGIFHELQRSYTTVVTGSCLNFSDKYPVNALFRIRNGCEKVVYFTDNLNPYRVVSLTDTTDFASEGLISNCDKIALYRPNTNPCFNLFIGEGDIGINDTGGLLEVGAYYFAFRYLDKEQNPTDYFFITRPIAIGDENYDYNNSVENINLYDGGSNVETSPYYVNKTNKSIRLTLSQLDTTFSYYQIAVIKRTGEAGEISSVDVLFPIPISGTSDTKFVYTGIDSQIQTQTSIDDVLAIKQPVEKVAAHAQVDNRLYIANTSKSLYQFDQFQRYASLIKTEWLKDDTTSPVDAYTREGKYYFQEASFMEDEIYPFGVYYKMGDGSISPVFSVIGRAPDVVTGSNPIIGTDGVTDDSDTWDTGTTTTYGALFNSTKTKRWQLISTATKYTFGGLSGLMGYHEAESATYPDIPTCDGESYWGEDWQGNLITPGVTKIRHHRMPGPELRISTSDNTASYRVGVKFSNVSYPPGAVKHYFVYGDRSMEKTILAKGALVPLSPRDTTNWWQDLINPSDENNYVFDPRRLSPEVLTYDSVTLPLKTYAFICSEGLLKDKLFKGNYFRVERFARDPQWLLAANNQESDTVYVQQYDTTIIAETNMWGFSKHTTPDTVINYDIDFTGKLPKATYGSNVGTSIHNPVEDFTIQNNSFNISPQVITLGDSVQEYVDAGETPIDSIIVGSIKVDADPFTNLYNINYKRMDNCAKTANSTSSIFTSYSGDTFVSRVNLTDFTYKQVDGGSKTMKAYHMAFTTQDSGLNYEMRHGSTNPVYSYFQWNYQYDTQSHGNLRRYLASKYYESQDDVMELYPENPGYNDSYSYLHSLETYLPIPFNYEFCNECAEKFPYRIYYSEKDNHETQQDAYRIFRPNNYRDLEGSTGEITDMFINFDELYTRTVKSPYHLSTRPQQIQTDSSSVYLGTGEVLSIPPKQLKTTDFAFGGGRFFKSRVNTEYGTFYVDDISGRPFLLTNQLNDLSIQGMRNFWEENGKIELFEQFRDLTSIEFPYKSTTNGVGYISTYNPRFKTIIVHKRDYKILPAWQNSFHYEDALVDEPLDYAEPNALWYNNFNYYHNDSGGTAVMVSLDSPIYFENKSFTLSYSFLTNTWVSFHSYLPLYAFNGNKNFYTFTDNLYEHNEGDFQTYYGNKYDHILDIVAPQNASEIKYSNNVVYSSTTYGLDPDTNSVLVVPTTFNEFIAYNNDQITGVLELVLKQSPFQTDNNNTTALVAYVDKLYRIGNIRDMTFSNTLPIWSHAWIHKQSSPYSFIDKVPNPNNILTSKSVFEMARLRDHYLGMRFFFNPQQNYKINTDVISTIYANRNR